MKQTLTAIATVLTLLMGATRATALTALYTPTGSNRPQDQGWFAFGQIPPATPPLVVNASQTPTANGVTVNTQVIASPGFPPGTTANTGYVGYSNYTYNSGTNSLDKVNPAFPSLDPATGFTLAFAAGLASETSNPNRAGFSVTVISNDQRGVELAFRSSGIFAQAPNFNSEAQSVSRNTTSLTNYELRVAGGNYELFAINAGSPVSTGLSGALQAYNFNPAASSPPLPFNPYTTPDFLFFGDNTDQGRSTFTLGAVSLTNAAPVPFEFSPTLGFVILGGWGVVYQWKNRKKQGRK
jgi:hypothetical protein